MRRTAPAPRPLRVGATVLFLLGGAHLTAALALLSGPGLADGRGLAVPAELSGRAGGVLAARYALTGVAAVVAALVLRRERGSGWRLALATLGGMAASAVLPPGPDWFTLLLVAVCGALLCARTSRQAVRQSPTDRALAAAEDRAIRLARRRLTPESPPIASLRIPDRRPNGEHRSGPGPTSREAGP